MDLLRRYRFVLIFGIVVGLLLMGRGWMLSNEAGNPTPLVTPAQPSASVSLPSSDEPAETASVNGTDTSVVGTFRGRVVDAATREPVREFELQFYDGRSSAAITARAFRTNDGRFEWRDAPVGRWIATASARGYQRFELPGLAISTGETTADIVMPLRRGYSVSGRVYDEISRSSIASASIAFREAHVGAFEGNFRMRARAASDKNGSFVLDGVPAGSVTLSISAQNYATRELDLVVVEKNPPLEIGLSSGAAISGYLAAADGTPVAGQVGLWHREQGFGSTSRTGDAGEFSFRHLAAGRYELSGRAATGMVEREIVLADNERIEGIVLMLAAGGSIRGVVTGLRPEEIGKTTVSVQRGDAIGVTLGGVPVDARGAYVLKGVPQGRMRVVAAVAGRAHIARTVEMPDGTDITVDFDFPRGARLSGRVTRAGKPLAGARVVAYARPRTGQDQVDRDGATTTSNGDYVIDDLAAGEYSIWVDSYTSRSVRVAGDTVFDIEIPLADLAGVVLEGEGNLALAGAHVVVWSAPTTSTRVRLNATSDHFGRFTLAGMEPGEFIFTAYKPGYEMFRERISYGSPMTDMRIRLRAARGTEIRVHEAGTGRSLRDLYVMELMGDRNGNTFPLHLDENGVGYLPTALAGSTLVFSANDHLALTIRDWNGQGLELKLERRPP